MKKIVLIILAVLSFVVGITIWVAIIDCAYQPRECMLANDADPFGIPPSFLERVPVMVFAVLLFAWPPLVILKQQTLKKMTRITFWGSMVFVAASLVIMFKAGCLGDAKSANVGDPLAALAMERKSDPFFLGSILLGTLALAWNSKQNRAVGLFVAWLVGTVGTYFIWYLSIEAEGMGISACF